GDGEEIAGDDRLAVVGEKRRPAAGGIAATWNASQIPGDAAVGDVEAESQEFAMDHGRPPVRILRCQATDQGPNLLADPRPAPARSGSPAPVEAKAGSMPADYRLQFDDDQDVRPSRPHPSEGGPEHAVKAGQRRPRPFALEHRDLLAEREDLQSGIGATAEADAHGSENR